MLFDVASSMFRCHTDLITSNGVPATQANPPRIVIIEYLFPERSNHFFLPFDFHSFSTLSLYTYIYIYVYREEIFTEISEFSTRYRAILEICSLGSGRRRRSKEDRREEKRNSSALPVQWLAASRTIRADSGIEADKKTRYDIVRDKDITHY